MDSLRGYRVGETVAAQQSVAEFFAEIFHPRAVSQVMEGALCSEAAKLDRFWLEFSAPIPRLGGAESDEGIDDFRTPRRRSS